VERREGRAVSPPSETARLGPEGAVIVLDTHAWLWLCLEPRRLSAAAAGIRRATKNGGLAIASITLWEVGWSPGDA
jgi:hypothetical protein